MRPNYLPVNLKAFVAILALVFVGSAYAANWYVRPNFQGSNTGNDWNNAWSMSGINWSNVKPGDTVWLAGGTYTSVLRVLANGNSSARIVIKRASANDAAPVAAAGWQASFDSQVVFNQLNPCIDVPNQNYITIDGNNPSIDTSQLLNNSRPYGIKCIAAQNGGYTITVGENQWSGTSYPVTDISFINVDNLGPYVTGPGQATGAAYGFYALAYYQTKTNLLLRDCRWQGYCESFQTDNWVNSIIEYCYIGEEPAYAVLDHPDVFLNSGSSSNFTIRYSVITKSHADGIIFDPGGFGRWNFYGNVYWGSFNALIDFNGAGPFGPYYFFNNVFAAGGTTNPDFNNTIPAWCLNSGGAVSGSQVYNNIFWNCGNWLSVSGVASDYNAYNSDNPLGTPPSEPHVVTFTGNPFVNSAAGDFHLTAAAAAKFANGIALANDGYINVDLDGKQRGNPWYIGAYQYSSGAEPPAPPTNLRITSSP